MSQNSKPFTTGIRSFDHHCGSQARGGDSWLFFGCPGAGKTILACQTAGHAAQSLKRVLYITTKESPEHIIMRIYSAVSSIPYASIKELKGTPNHPLAPAFVEWLNAYGNQISIATYTNLNGFEENYKQIIAKFIQKNGVAPDLTILDQLSGVLQPPYSDHIEKLKACNKVANLVASTSRKLDNVAILVAQANTKCSNKLNLTENDTADSKTLSSSMTHVLGITSILNHEKSVGPLTRDNQYFVICKCPNANALRITVKARFHMARFEGIG